MEKHVQISKFDDERQIVYGEVYVPNVLDSQGDFMTAEEVERMAHNFMARGRVTKVDTNHDLVENGSYIVESFIARSGDPDFIPGSWVLGTHIPDKGLWQQVRKGEINGYSIYGSGTRQPRQVEIEIPDDGVVKGATLASDGHQHTYRIQFADDGTFMGGETDVVDGHSHRISRGTATEVSAGHSHRYSFLENFV